MVELWQVYKKSLIKKENEMEAVRKDCFAYKTENGKIKCIALREMECTKGQCKFYKSREQYRKEVKKYGFGRICNGLR